MSSVLHFSPAFKPSKSLLDVPPSLRKSSTKRKRGLDSLEDDSGESGGERVKADLTANDTSLPSENPNTLVTTSLAAPDVGSSRSHEGFHVINGPQFFSEYVTETAPSISKEQISDALVTLKPPLYIATGKVPTATAEKATSTTGLRQHHLKTMTAVLHRCLLKSDYSRAGRAWAMLLRAEHQGQSMDLRTHDRWGVGAEILMHRGSQVAQKTLDHTGRGISNLNINLGIEKASLEKAKEYYERVVLQYPFRKALPNASGAMSFSVAMFSLWIYAIKERISTALTSAGSSDNGVDKTDAEANERFQSSSASDIEPDHNRERENIKRDGLTSAHEIAARLDGLLVSPPYSDNAKLWKLCGEISLWIADLLVLVPTVVSSHSSNFRGFNGDLTMECSILSGIASGSTPRSQIHSAEQKQQIALAKAEEAFQRVKICCRSTAE